MYLIHHSFLRGNERNEDRLKIKGYVLDYILNV